MTKSLGKVIFIDTVHDVLWERLVQSGWECIDNTQLETQDILKDLSNYDGIVIRSRFKLTQEVLSKLPKLQFIARAGSGLENIDLNYCQTKNIQVFSSPEGNRDALAEHAMGMLLMLQNHLKRADNEVREGIWKRAENRGFELKGKTIGLIGYGTMAKAFAERLKGFGVKIIAYDKFKKNFSDSFVQEVNLKELCKQSNIVSLHTNYLPENKYLIDENFINNCKNPFVLINTARGFNVNTNDLVKGIKTGKILGACLDVLEYESVSFESVPNEAASSALNYLKESSRVILSPHIAGWTIESHFKLSDVLADKIENWAKAN